MKEFKPPSDRYSIIEVIECPLCEKDGSGWIRDIKVGWTKVGIQVYCQIHRCNIMHMDFEGERHPKVISELPKKIDDN